MWYFHSYGIYHAVLFISLFGWQIYSPYCTSYILHWRRCAALLYMKRMSISVRVSVRLPVSFPQPLVSFNWCCSWRMIELGEHWWGNRQVHRGLVLPDSSAAHINAFQRSNNKIGRVLRSAFTWYKVSWKLSRGSQNYPRRSSTLRKSLFNVCKNDLNSSPLIPSPAAWRLAAVWTKHRCSNFTWSFITRGFGTRLECVRYMPDRRNKVKVGVLRC